MTAQARLAATLALQHAESPRPMPRDVCPHCRRATTVHGWTAPDGHWLETHHCAEHGDVAPLHSPILNDHEQQASTLAVNTIENEGEFRNLDASHALRQRGAREEFAAWREAHPNFTSRELLDHWQRICRAWRLGPPEPPPRKRKTP